MQTLIISVSGGHWTGSCRGLHTTPAARTGLRSSRRPSLVLRSWVRSPCRPMASRHSPGSSRQVSPPIRSDCISCQHDTELNIWDLAMIPGFSQVSQSCFEMLCSLLMALQWASCLAPVTFGHLAGEEVNTSCTIASTWGMCMQSASTSLTKRYMVRTTGCTHSHGSSVMFMTSKTSHVFAWHTSTDCSSGLDLAAQLLGTCSGASTVQMCVHG